MPFFTYLGCLEKHGRCLVVPLFGCQVQFSCCVVTLLPSGGHTSESGALCGFLHFDTFVVALFSSVAFNSAVKATNCSRRFLFLLRESGASHSFIVWFFTAQNVHGSVSRSPLPENGNPATVSKLLKTRFHTGALPSISRAATLALRLLEHLLLLGMGFHFEREARAPDTFCIFVSKPL